MRKSSALRAFVERARRLAGQLGNYLLPMEVFQDFFPEKTRVTPAEPVFCDRLVSKHYASVLLLSDDLRQTLNQDLAERYCAIAEGRSPDSFVVSDMIRLDVLRYFLSWNRALTVCPDGHPALWSEVVNNLRCPGFNDPFQFESFDTGFGSLRAQHRLSALLTKYFFRRAFDSSDPVRRALLSGCWEVHHQPWATRDLSAPTELIVSELSRWLNVSAADLLAPPDTATK